MQLKALCFHLIALLPLFTANSVRAYPGSAREVIAGSDRHIYERGILERHEECLEETSGESNDRGCSVRRQNPVDGQNYPNSGWTGGPGQGNW
ncbi:hypothetical protein OG21DRAFT_1511230 [Imleria badia]|nr:hypothetical protein OG21DRAFT_1511230 [Imleria badia]